MMYLAVLLVSQRQPALMDADDTGQAGSACRHLIICTLDLRTHAQHVYCYHNDMDLLEFILLQLM